MSVSFDELQNTLYIDEKIFGYYCTVAYVSSIPYQCASRVALMIDGIIVWKVEAEEPDYKSYLPSIFIQKLKKFGFQHDSHFAYFLIICEILKRNDILKCVTWNSARFDPLLQSMRRDIYLLEKFIFISKYESLIDSLTKLNEIGTHISEWIST